jgi:thioredoxin-related protein
MDLEGRSLANHPHFDDHGAVRWHLDYAKAVAEARATGKRILIESGRTACAGCRALVEEIIPRPEIRDLLNVHFICMADDCDRMDAAVRALALSHLPRARTLPFILLVDANGRWLGGSSGKTTAEAFLELLRAAVGSEG